MSLKKTLPIDLRDFVEKFHLGMILTDESGTIVEVNQFALQILRSVEIELIGQNIFDRIENNDKNEIIENLISTPGLITLDSKFIINDNSSKHIKINAGQISANKNAVQFIFIFSSLNDGFDSPEIMLNAILDNFPDSIYFKDLDSRFVRVNKGNYSKFGYKSELEMYGKTDYELFADEHASKADLDEKEIIDSGKPLINIEEKEVWPDGRITWVSTSKFPLKDLDGKTIGTFGSSKDITKLKEIELKLKESEERYRNLSRVTFEGIILHDKGIVVDTNESFLNMTGYTLDELVGKSIIDIAVDPQDRQRVIRNVLNDVMTPYEIIGVRKNGEKFVAELEARLFMHNGKKLRVAAVRDVTDRFNNTNLQSALYKISETVSEIDDIANLYVRIHEIIKTLMPADNFYIALFDKENDSLSFPYFVDQFDDPPSARKFGKGLTEYILRTDQDMLIDSKLDQELRERGETDLLGELSKIWLGVRLKTKNNLIGAIVLQDYDHDDTYGEKEKEILTFVSEQIAMAIDKKRSEDKLKKYSEELSELVASKDKFFSIVAHDLKSPFTALLGYSEMIANEYMEMTKDELKEFAVNMNEVAKKTFSLLENLLEWSRVQTGRMKYSPENLSVFQITQQVIELYLENARKKGIYLKNRVNPAHEIFGDQNMLFAIFRNLTSNALKYTNKGGEVTIYSTEKDNIIEITVQDTGVGMKERDINKLFRIDVHHSEIGTEAEKGTGLGLILCKELVQKNGGDINVKSQLGKGSSFIFTIPSSNKEF